MYKHILFQKYIVDRDKYLIVKIYYCYIKHITKMNSKLAPFIVSKKVIMIRRS